MLKKIQIILLCMGVLFISTSNVEGKTTLNLKSEHVYVMHIDSGKVIYQKNANEKMIPASLTKIVSVLVALEEIKDVTKTITFAPEDFAELDTSNASIAGFLIGEKVPIIDVLYGIMLPSGADACLAIAHEVSGGEKEFVKLMNKKVKALGLKNTNFTNTSGLYDKNQYTSAKDLAIILKAAIKNPLFVEMFEADTYQTSSNNIHGDGIAMYSTRVANFEILNIEKGEMLGSKTGYTSEGGLCLASTALINKAKYIVVNGNAGGSFDSGNHFKDGYKIYDFIRGLYKEKNYYKSGQVLEKKSVAYGKIKEVEAYIKDDVNVLEKIKNSQIKVAVEIDSLKAPVTKNEHIGSIIVSENDQEIKTYKIYAKDASEMDVGAFVFYIFLRYGTIAIVLYGLIILIRQKRSKKKKKYRL